MSLDVHWSKLSSDVINTCPPSTTSVGSTTFPADFDIFSPFSSTTNPWTITFLDTTTTTTVLYSTVFFITLLKRMSKHVDSVRTCKEPSLEQQHLWAATTETILQTGPRLPSTDHLLDQRLKSRGEKQLTLVEPAWWNIVHSHLSKRDTMLNRCQAKYPWRHCILWISRLRWSHTVNVMKTLIICTIESTTTSFTLHHHLLFKIVWEQFVNRKWPPTVGAMLRYELL